MTTATFDTSQYFEKLKAAGVPEEQAKIQADALRKIIDEQFVTKDYLDYRLKELEYRLIISLGGIMAICTAIFLAGLPLLLK